MGGVGAIDEANDAESVAIREDHREVEGANDVRCGASVGRVVNLEGACYPLAVS
jgi:hypothetical protein